MRSPHRAPLRGLGMRALAGTAAVGLVLGVASTTTGTSALAAAPAAPVDAIAAGLVPDVRTFAERTAYPLAAGVADTVAAWTRTPAGLAQQNATAATTPAVGTVRMWPSLDDVQQTLYVKEYTLRGVGDGIEVWVASGAGPDGVMGTDPLPNDCRRVVPGSFTLTDAQIGHLIQQYDENILPKESKAFSVAPERDGSKAPNQSGSPVAGLTFPGDGDKVITLVDNVRDPNFYDFPANQTYIAGFFSRQFNELTDRNIMTIDAYDWAHRTNRTPQHEPDDDICKSRPARPDLYEGIFAHEYQHLLQYYVDPNEVNFINEGLSDYAENVTGYANPGRSVFQPEHESHIICYQGFGTVTSEWQPNARPCGGPQNSLTLWGDEGEGAEILADYGVAWSFLIFLRDRYGDPMLEDIHRDTALQGLASISAALEKHGDGAKITDVLHDFQVMVLIDRIAGSAKGKVAGIDKARVTTPGLKSGFNLLNPAGYAALGVAPNGADYVPLRGRGAAFLDGADLDALSFAGRTVLDAIPLAWTTVPSVPLLPTISFPQLQGVPPTADIPPPALPASPLDNPALFSGNAGNTDASAVFEVTVPTDAPVLTYTTSYNMEAGFDYGYTVISTDGGKTYTSLANNATVPTAAPAPGGQALTGTSGAPVVLTFDLAQYAGQEVLLGFRYRSDPLINNGGWYIDDVRVGSALISDGTSTAPFRSFTQVNPQTIAPWTVAIVGLDEDGKRVRVIRKTNTYDFALTPAQIRKLRTFPVVVAVVSHDDLTEKLVTYAPYTLRANDVGQLGGR